MKKLNTAEENKLIQSLDIDGSILYLTYLHTGNLPTLDELLDWRNQLSEMSQKYDFPQDWFDREIRATDYLLSKIESN